MGQGLLLLCFCLVSDGVTWYQIIVKPHYFSQLPVTCFRTLPFPGKLPPSRLSSPNLRSSIPRAVIVWRYFLPLEKHKVNFDNVAYEFQLDPSFERNPKSQVKITVWSHTRFHQAFASIRNCLQSTFKLPMNCSECFANILWAHLDCEACQVSSVVWKKETGIIAPPLSEAASCVTLQFPDSHFPGVQLINAGFPPLLQILCVTGWKSWA